MVHDKNKHECTMHGLQHWFEAKFEKLGWMSLASEHGNDLKVASYLQSISHLKECIKDKIETVHDIDRKNDLKIMLGHTETLCSAAHKLLDSNLSSSSKNKKYPHQHKEHDATFYGLHKWETAMFEKLGWMVLSKKEGNNLKIKAYMHSINCLKEMLTKKIGQVEEKDSKADLKILYEDTRILWRAAYKLLRKSECMSEVRLRSYSSHSKNYKNVVVHSDEAAPGMVVRVDKKGKKYLSKQSYKSMARHNKPRHTRKDKYAPKKRTKKRTKKSSKSSKSSKNSGTIFGGLF
jgi:hypothetical protein